MTMKNTNTPQSEQTDLRSGVKVLLVNASSRIHDSVTRQLTENLVNQIDKHYGVEQLTIRDVAANPLPVIDESWVTANFTDPTQRTNAQKATLALSDELVNELKATDVIILGVPIYNFGVPAALKAWIDLVARAGLTFRYTSDGPVGLLKEKHAFVVVASGGVAINSEIDFATPYLKQALKFIGIEEVSLVTAERLNVNSEAGKQQAEEEIVKAVSSYQHQQSNAA